MVRVMTVNLLNGCADPVSLGRVLDEVSPDVVAAQELGFNAADVLAARFPHGRLEPADDHSGRGLVSVGPIDVSDLPLPYRGGLRGAVDVGGSTAELISVHLANPIDPPRGRLRERRGQLAALEAILQVPTPRILVGDLNSTPLWPAYRRLVRHLDDVVAEWAKIHAVRRPRTWGYRPWWPAVLAIDHVLASGFRAVSVAVERIRGTDHRALVVDVVPDLPTGRNSPR